MRNLLLSTLLLLTTLKFNYSAAQTKGTHLEGTIIDKTSGESVIGATIFFPDLKKGASSDLDGFYNIENLPVGVFKVEVACIGYQTIVISDMEIKPGKNGFDILLEEATNLLNEIVVTSVKRMNSEIAMVQATRTAGVVMSGMSSRQITKSQDRNAAEVVKRIPGVSIINDRYIIVRGLPSRYNNVWVNNSSVPSTEADSRSFSFDILPSAQLESIMIVKSQSAELPSDFSGGFVKITTGSMPEKSETIISYGTGINSVTHFNKQLRNKASSTDFLGFDSGERALKSIVPLRLDNYNGALVTDVTKRGFREEWGVKEGGALPDQRLSLMLNRYYLLKKGSKLGLTAALNYSLTSQTYKDMLNARFGVYNTVTDEPEFIYKYTDNQYSIDAKVGGCSISHI